MHEITLFTIGFTSKSAETFFTSLTNAGVRRMVDIRIKNVSQLAGFAKRDDLRYFLHTLAGIDYEHHPELAPTPDLLKAYRSKEIGWDEFERRFTNLMRERRLETLIEPIHLDHACLLCSEAAPRCCHRRLVAEHLRDTLGGIRICHL